MKIDIGVPSLKDFARMDVADPEFELASRELARKKLIHFTTYTYPQYMPEDFHIQLAEILEHVISGDIKRLMIFAPPQHGKSEMVSVRLPAFWLSKHPSMPVLLCSYGASLAIEKLSASRAIVNSDMYYNLFPQLFKPAPRFSRLKWVMKNANSKFYGAGVRGSITGRGAGLAIIDDPVKDWMEAYSGNVREKTWEWWKGTFRTRVWANGRIIIIMTRWHTDDLAGRILNDAGEKWTIVRYPAIAETDEERETNEKKYLKGAHANRLFKDDPLQRNPGDPLCARRYPLNSLIDIKNDVGPRAWHAEYQGTPRPIEGNQIKSEWIHLVDDYPKDEVTMMIRYWDKAATEGGGANTSGLLLASTRQKTYYVLDIVSGQWSPFQRNEIMLNTAHLDRETYGEGRVKIWVETEPGAGGKESTLRTIREMAGFSVHGETVRIPKTLRMEPVTAQLEAGNIYILKKKWTPDFIDELLMWPFGVRKDKADSLSGAFRKSNSGLWTRSGGE